MREHGSGNESPAAPTPRTRRRRMFTPGCKSVTELRPVADRRSRRRSIPRNVYAATKVHQEHLCFAL